MSKKKNKKRIAIDVVNQGTTDITADRWAVQGNIFKPIGEGGRSPVIPPGVFSMEVTPFGWFLAQKSSRYELPFKIYGTHDHIINRISRAWDNKNGNLSVLFNGLKGTGKTVSAQLLANWAIDRGMPVISLTSYTPQIEDMLAQLKQPVLLLFDEFEKNFIANPNAPDEENRASAQQKMLSIIDGLSRSQFRRLFLFTSNNKRLDDNMIDRPSRIRYIFEFENLADSIISELLDDILSEEAAQFKQEIIDYTSTLKVLSMDAIKVIAEEVNIFLEPPSAFKNIINLTEKRPWHYTVDIVDIETKETITSMKKNKMYPTAYERLETFRGSLTGDNTVSLGDGFHLHQRIGTNEYLVSLQVPRDQTWLGSITKKKDRELVKEIIPSYTKLWRQEEPEADKKGRSFADRFKAADEEDKREILYDIYHSDSEYGNDGRNVLYPVRFVPCFETPSWSSREDLANGYSDL